MKSQYKRTTSYVMNWFFWWCICSFCVGAQILSVCGIETSAMLKHICQILLRRRGGGFITPPPSRTSTRRTWCAHAPPTPPTTSSASSSRTVRPASHLEDDWWSAASSAGPAGDMQQYAVPNRPRGAREKSKLPCLFGQGMPSTSSLGRT